MMAFCDKMEIRNGKVIFHKGLVQYPAPYYYVVATIAERDALTWVGPGALAYITDPTEEKLYIKKPGGWKLIKSDT